MYTVAPVVTEGQLLNANAIFQADLSLVDHPDEDRVSTLGRPHAKGRYSQTDVGIVPYSQLVAAVEGKDLVVINTCMEQAFARFVYDQVVRYNRSKMPIFMGTAGGPAQWDSEERVVAMRTIHQFFVQHARSVHFVLVPHTDNCGGLGHYAMEGVPVCSALKCNPNDGKEQTFVKGRVDQTQSLIIPSQRNVSIARYWVGHRDKPRMTPF